MIDKHAILGGLVMDECLVRVIEVNEDFTMAEVNEEIEKGGVVGVLRFPAEGERYAVMDLDEDPKKLIVKILFPIEKLIAVFNLRYQPVVAILK